MAFKIKNFEQISYSMINWMNNLASKITDFTVGSVIRTLLESVALELEELYFRTYSATQESQAEGVYEAFDFPRKSAKKALGSVTFYRTSVDTEDYTINVGTQVATVGTESTPEVVYETLTEATLYVNTGITEEIAFTIGTNIYYIAQKRVNNIISLVGTLSSNAHTFIEDTDYQLVVGSSGSYIEWLSGGDNPDDSTSFIVNYIPLSIDVQVMALEAGSNGNASAEELTVIRTSVLGIDGVTNYGTFTSGTDEETDDERKVRFSDFIEGLARGTLTAIRYAIFNKTSRYTVHSAYILENEPIPGFIKIYVSDSSGLASDDMLADVIEAVEPYRGAGIVVNIAKPTPVLIDIHCKLRVAAGYNKEIITQIVDQALKDHLNTYKFLNEKGYSTVYLTNLDYIVKSARPSAIIEADIAFKRQDGVWPNPSNPLDNRLIADITPTTNATKAEIFRPGNITVTYFS